MFLLESRELSDLRLRCLCHPGFLSVWGVRGRFHSLVQLGSYPLCEPETRKNFGQRPVALGGIGAFELCGGFRSLRSGRAQFPFHYSSEPEARKFVDGTLASKVGIYRDAEDRPCEACMLRMGAGKNEWLMKQSSIIVSSRLVKDRFDLVGPG